MTMFKRVLSTVVLGAALAIPAFGQAGPGGGGGQGGGGGGQGGGGRGGFGGGGGRMGVPQQPQQTPLQRIEATQKAVTELATDQQKPKFEEMFKKLGDELTPLKDRLAKLEAEKKEIEDKINQLAAAERNDINDLLTEEQKAQLRDKLVVLNGGGGAGGGGMMGGRVQAILQNADLKLTDEQKTKLTALSTDMQAKFAKLRETSGGDRQAMGEAMRTAFQDMQTQLKDILTPEQMTKVQQLMPMRGGPGGPGGGAQGGGGQGGGGRQGGQGGGGRRGGGGGAGGGNVQ